MQTALRKNILPLSVISFLMAGVLFSTQVLAVGKPAGVGQNHPQYTGKSNPGSGYSQQTGTNPSGAASITGNATASGIPQQGHTGMSHKPSFAQVHLQEGKLRACQAISSSVTTRSTHLVDLVTRMEKTFTSIADGVEQYYLTKVVPTGTILPNYDALVADITTKENAIAPLVEAAQADATGFSCTGNNPAAQLTQYRTDMQGVLKGLQDYRTSIKNLIVAVHTLPSKSASTTPSVAPSSTPSATLAPTETETPTVTPSVTP